MNQVKMDEKIICLYLSVLCIQQNLQHVADCIGISI
jgi:hypothetical protein